MGCWQRCPAVGGCIQCGAQESYRWGSRQLLESEPQEWMDQEIAEQVCVQ